MGKSIKSDKDHLQYSTSSQYNAKKLSSNVLAAIKHTQNRLKTAHYFKLLLKYVFNL